ncbi:MAG TPA: ribose 5-phosphate isomerase B [Patescibacteria group bacterium]|nr:ribose 5-phosphate isomerase B [Patescibacteria group bacterium]
MSQKIIAMASDHGGYELKSILKDELVKAGWQVLDLGTHGPDSVDYPDYAHAMATALSDGQAERGVLICGTGIGISIAANRYAHIRAALVHDSFTARMSRQHNNANVLVLGGRVIGSEVAKDCLKSFLETEFEGGRHASRLAKIGAPEK